MLNNILLCIMAWFVTIKGILKLVGIAYCNTYIPTKIAKRVCPSLTYDY